MGTLCCSDLPQHPYQSKCQKAVALLARIEVPNHKKRTCKSPVLFICGFKTNSIESNLIINIQVGTCSTGRTNKNAKGEHHLNRTNRAYSVTYPNINTRHMAAPKGVLLCTA